MYWEAGYKIFVGHDCAIYELSIKIMMSKQDFEENMIFHSTGAHDSIVLYEDIGSGDSAMTFRLTPDSPTLGLMLSDKAEANVHYDTYWQYCEE